MTLQDLVKETKIYENGLLIVEFNNGQAAAYEKEERRKYLIEMDLDGMVLEKRQLGFEDCIVKYTLLPNGILKYTTLPNEKKLKFMNNAEYLGRVRKKKQFNGRFSESSVKNIEDYLSAYLPARDVPVAQALYGEAVKPLGLKEIRYRDWEEINGGLMVSLTGWPRVIISMITGKRITPSGDGDLAYLVGPFILPPLMIKEMIVPSEKGFKITNKKNLKAEPDGINPALVLDYDLGKPNKFQSLSLFFPDGTNINEYGINRFRHMAHEYEQKKLFLEVNGELREMISDYINHKETNFEEWGKFGKFLKESDQLGMLRKIGFLEERK